MGPQVYPALREMNIRMYLDESDHVGIDDQPFYYGGMLNVFKMRSNLARMNLNGGDSLANGKSTFTKVYEQLRSRGGGTISIYYHPNEWVQTEFWDAVNFRRGANTPRADWKPPGTKPAAATEQAFADFEQYVQFIKAQPGVRFVTATELMTIYADRAMTRSFGRDELLRLARSAQREISFQKMDDYALSAADVFGLLTERRRPTSTAIRCPPRPRSCRSTVRRAATHHRQRARDRRASLGQPSLERFATHPTSAERLIVCPTRSGSGPRACRRRTTSRRSPMWLRVSSRPASRLRPSHATTASSPPIDSLRRIPWLWSWPIFPEGFHAPRIMELARLQAWTLKPAMRQR